MINEKILKTMWCLKCNKPAKSWDHELVPTGLNISASCLDHGMSVIVSHAEMRTNIPYIAIESLLKERGYELRERRE